MFKKLRTAIFPLIGVVLMALTMVAVPTPTAHAWVDSYNPDTDCQALATREFDSFFTVMKNEGVYDFDSFIRFHLDFPQHGSLWNIDINDDTQSYFLVGQFNGAVNPPDGETTYYFVAEADPDDNIKFYNDRIVIPAGLRFETIITPDQSINWYMDSLTQTSQPETVLDVQANATCIHKVGNVQYHGNYTGPTYESYQDTQYEEPGCDWTDVACHMGNLWNGISDTFIGIGTTILDGIIALFIPDLDALTVAFGAIGDALTNTLGFVIYPITWLVDTANAMISQGATTGGINLGTFFGSRFIVDFQAPLQNMGWMSGLFDLAKAGIVLSLMFTLWHKYMEVVRG